MGKGGCVDGQLTTTFYGSPVPFIGVYIAAGTLVCFFCMTYDMVSGLTRRKPFLPCKLFPMNSFTMAVLAVATKIPLDLTSPMPRATDQLSKLTATALMCTSIGFYMPSLGNMRASKRYGNLAALSIMVITMVVNVCIQLHTGVIFEFIVEHIFIVVCISVLLVLMWSSALAFSGQKDEVSKTRVLLPVGEDLEGLRSTLSEIHRINYESNPQTLLCSTTHHHAFGILCAVSSIPVLVAIPRWLFIAPENMKSQCSGASDYKWSIPIVIVIQFLTIAVGTFSIIYRWFSFMLHCPLNKLYDAMPNNPAKELEELKEEDSIVLAFINKNLSNLLMATKDKILDAIIGTQMILYTFTRCFFGKPLYNVTKFLVHTIFRRESVEPLAGRLSTMAEKERSRWSNIACKGDFPRQNYVIKLIDERRPSCADSPSTSNAAASASAFEISCRRFINHFEAVGRDYLKNNATLDQGKNDYEYRFSCLTLLVLSGIIEELVPDDHRSKESLKQALNDELFEIIYFVDQNCISAFSVRDHAKLVAAKQLWPRAKHIELVRGIMSITRQERERYDSFKEHLKNSMCPLKGTIQSLISSGSSLASKRDDLVALEFCILSNFILGNKKFEQDVVLWHFLEVCVVQMVCYMLVMLPSAIVKEITADYVTEIDETRVKKAWKFFSQLKLWREVEKKPPRLQLASGFGLLMGTPPLSLSSSPAGSPLSRTESPPLKPKKKKNKKKNYNLVIKEKKE